jgi:hypothetical protein
MMASKRCACLWQARRKGKKGEGSVRGGCERTRRSSPTRSTTRHLALVKSSEARQSRISSRLLSFAPFPPQAGHPLAQSGWWRDSGNIPAKLIPNFGQTSVGRGVIFIPKPKGRDDETERKEHCRNIVALSRPELPGAPVGV